MFTTALAGGTVAKKMGRPSNNRNDVSVRLDRAIAAKAKSIATHQGVSLAEWLTEKLRTTVDKDYATMLRKLDPQSSAKPE